MRVRASGVNGTSGDPPGRICDSGAGYLLTQWQLVHAYAAMASLAVRWEQSDKAGRLGYERRRAPEKRTKLAFVMSPLPPKHPSENATCEPRRDRFYELIVRLP